MDSPLDWTHPKNILPVDSLESFVRFATSLVNSPSGSSRIAVKAGWKVKNHTDVSVNLLLVSHDLRGLHAYMSVLKNLVRPRIRRHSLLETQGPVNILRQLTQSTSL